ncbi:MAG TPA: TlpA disulfide reductase family protein [Telluria sp.]|jgi:thiol-disulfide isomerase/thioredoxin
MIAKLLCSLVIGLALLLSAPLHAAWQRVVNGSMVGKRMPPLPAALDPAGLSGSANVGAGSGTGNGARGAASNGVVLVHFWAPWCVACHENVPELSRLQREYGAQGLRVVGLAREPPADVSAFARRNPLVFPVGSDAGGALFAGLGVHSLPYAVLVDRNGIIVWQGDPLALDRGTLEATLAAPALGALVRF